MIYLVYNPLANNGKGAETKDVALAHLSKIYEGEEVKVLDAISTEISDLIKELKKDDKVVILGGDGTLMRFANKVYGKNLPCSFYLYRAGTGNDFLRDVEKEVKDDMVELNKYLKNLPVIEVNDKSYVYLNGIGYGIDGFVCEIADKMRAEGKTNINYASLSVKNLLHGYKCPSAKITIDGKSKKYKKVWLASTMNGRFYGGGMIPAPDQDRLSDKVSLFVFHDSGKLKTLLTFPKLFKGTHVSKKKIIDIMVGKDVTVEFSRPCALQIDGETVLNVSKYHVYKK